MKLMQMLICLLVGVFFAGESIFGFSVAENGVNMPHEEAKLTSIFLSCGGMTAPVCIDLHAEDERVIAVIEGDGVEIETAVAPEILAQAQQLIDQYNVHSWDGFAGEETQYMILDGESFSFYAEFSNGTTINAYGNNSFPENYSDFENAMTGLVQPIIEAYWAEFYAKPIVDTTIRSFSLKYQTENSSKYTFECEFTLRRDQNDAPYLKANISADQFAIEPHEQENMAGGRSGSWYRFYGEIIAPPYEALQSLVEEYEIAQWNGLNEADKTFSLNIHYESDEYIDISVAAIPEELHSFINAATDLILEYIAENREHFVEWE